MREQCYYTVYSLKHTRTQTSQREIERKRVSGKRDFDLLLKLMRFFSAHRIIFHIRCRFFFIGTFFYFIFKRLIQVR